MVYTALLASVGMQAYLQTPHLQMPMTYGGASPYGCVAFFSRVARGVCLFLFGDPPNHKFSLPFPTSPKKAWFASHMSGGSFQPSRRGQDFDLRGGGGAVHLWRQGGAPGCGAAGLAAGGAHEPRPNTRSREASQGSSPLNPKETPP